jgi:ferritin-like protein
MGSETYHEPLELLSERTRNMHRAIVSLKEELEAVDWYQQRAEAASDEALAAVLLHNKREEIEHALMVLEWIRRNDADFAERMPIYLFKTAPLTELEAEHKAALAAAGRSPGDASPTTDDKSPAPVEPPPVPGRPVVSGGARASTLGIGSLRR